MILTLLGIALCASAAAAAELSGIGLSMGYIPSGGSSVTGTAALYGDDKNLVMTEYALSIEISPITYASAGSVTFGSPDPGLYSFTLTGTPGINGWADITATVADGPYAGTTVTSTCYVGMPPDAAPSGLTATAVSSSQIDLSWADNSTNETEFYIQCWLDGKKGFTWENIGTVGVGVTTFSHTGRTPETNYNYRVFAYNPAGMSGYSNEADATTPAGSAPGTPTLSSPLDGATDVDTAPTLTWGAAAGADSYYVQIATAKNPDGSFPIASIQYETSTGSDTFIALPDGHLANSTVYYWHVKAVNAYGESAYSDAWSFTTIAAGAASYDITFNVNMATAAGFDNKMHGVYLRGSFNGWTGYDYQLTDADEDNVYSGTFNIAIGYQEFKYIYSNKAEDVWEAIGSNRNLTVSKTDNLATVNFNEEPAGSKPSIPVLSSPANGATDVSTNVTFSWAASTWADYYTVQAALSPTFDPPLALDFTTAGAETSIGVSLSANTTYYWRVQAYNTNGGSGWSETWSFTTGAGGGKPGAFELNSPPNGSTEVSTSPTTFMWTPAADTVIYRLEVSLTPGFESYVIQSMFESTSCEYPGLSAGTLYYWRVTACNGQGETPSTSGTWSFTTAGGGGSLPDAPVLSSPAHEAIDVAIDQPVPFAWKAVDGGGITYHIKLSTDEKFAVIKYETEGLTDPTVSVKATVFAAGTTYYWKVAARNAQGEGPDSPTWSFTTAGGSPPAAAPTLLAPANGAEIAADERTELSWTEVAGASLYRIQVATDPGFGAIYIDEEVPLTYIPIVFGKNQYFWRVAAKNGAGEGPKSETWSFIAEVPKTPPGAFSLLLPEDTASRDHSAISFRWTPADRADTYTLQISTDETFLACDQEVRGLTSTGVTLFNLKPLMTYYWRTKAVNGFGETLSKETYTLITTDGDKNGLLPPSDLTLSDIQATQITLNWVNNSDVTTYILRSTDNVAYLDIIDRDSGIATYTDNSVLPGTTYYYRVAVIDKKTGAMAASDPASATTLELPVVTASFTATNLGDLQVRLDASASRPSEGADITGYEWEFGDKSKETTSDPIMTHTFPAAEEYVVILTVIDSNKGSGTTEQKVTPSAGPPQIRHKLQIYAMNNPTDKQPVSEARVGIYPADKPGEPLLIQTNKDGFAEYEMAFDGTGDLAAYIIGYNYVTNNPVTEAEKVVVNAYQQGSPSAPGGGQSDIQVKVDPLDFTGQIVVPVIVPAGGGSGGLMTIMTSGPAELRIERYADGSGRNLPLAETVLTQALMSNGSGAYLADLSALLADQEGIFRVYCNGSLIATTVIIDHSAPQINMSGSTSIDLTSKGALARTQAVGIPINGQIIIIGTVSDPLSGLEGLRAYLGTEMLENISVSPDGSFLAILTGAELGSGNKTITLKAEDMAGNIGQAQLTVLVDNAPPAISEVTFDDNRIISGDFISALPTIKFRAADAASGVDPASLKVTIDGAELSGLTFDSATGLAEVTAFPALSQGSHSIIIRAADNVGNESQLEMSAVVSTELRLSAVLNSPNPFGEAGTAFTYQMTAEADVTVRIFTTRGQQVRQLTAAAGAEGGRAGFNSLAWDGRNEGGATLANGVYLYVITARDGSGETAQARGKAAKLQ